MTEQLIGFASTLWFPFKDLPPILDASTSIKDPRGLNSCWIDSPRVAIIYKDNLYWLYIKDSETNIWEDRLVEKVEEATEQEKQQLLYDEVLNYGTYCGDKEMCVSVYELNGTYYLLNENEKTATLYQPEEEKISNFSVSEPLKLPHGEFKNIYSLIMEGNNLEFHQYEDFTIESNDENIVSVTDDKTIYGEGIGTTTITLTGKNSGETAVLLINVYEMEGD